MRGHEGRVHDMQALGDGVISVSSDRLRRHSIGGLAKATFMPDQVRMHLVKAMPAASC